MPAQESPPQIPDMLGPYRCLRKLAVGGMGEVFLAEATGAGNFRKRLVIKAVRADRSDEKDIVQAFLDEARVWAYLTHPNIVPLFDCVWLEGRLCLVMEYIEGADLRELIQAAQAQKRQIQPGVVIHIISQLAAGLHAAHEARGSDGHLLGIVHRDVSPHNLLVDRQVNARLCDFGIARSAVRQNRTRTGRFKGKFAYVSPEAIRGDSVDRRADVFGMGVMLYELLTLERPFRADAPLPLLRMILEKDPPPLTRPVSRELQAVVTRSLAKDIEARFPNAEAFRLALLTTPEAHPEPSSTQLTAWFDALTGLVPDEPSTEPRLLDLAARAAARSIDDEAGPDSDDPDSESAESISAVSVVSEVGEASPHPVSFGLTGEVTLPRSRPKAPEPAKSAAPPPVPAPPSRAARPPVDKARPPVDAPRTASTFLKGPALPTRDLDEAKTVLKVPGSNRVEKPSRRDEGSPWPRRLREIWPYAVGGAVVGTAAIWLVDHYMR
jgi:eukaryotic-like serine/threonine-protein kinase